MQSDLGNVDAVDDDVARGRLDDPQQGQGEGRLPCSGPTHDPDLLSGFDTAGDLPEYEIEPISVP